MNALDKIQFEFLLAEATRNVRPDDRRDSRTLLAELLSRIPSDTSEGVALALQDALRLWLRRRSRNWYAYQRRLVLSPSAAPPDPGRKSSINRDDETVRQLSLVGATQTEIAERFGVSQAAVSQWMYRGLPKGKADHFEFLLNDTYSARKAGRG